MKQPESWNRRRRRRHEAKLRLALRREPPEGLVLGVVRRSDGEAVVAVAVPGGRDVAFRRVQL